MLKLHNSLSRTSEPVGPREPSGPITFYTCGQRSGQYWLSVFFERGLLRHSEFFGHEVIHVMNMTDVGHMTEDSSADGGQDKMEVAAERI